MATTVVGLFDEREDAQSAVQDLIAKGFDKDQVSVLASDPEGKLKSHHVDEHGNLSGEGAATGAVSGAVVGGALGWLIGAGLILLPIGGIVAAGPVAGLITGAVAGLAAGGILGGLIGLGIPKEQAEVYAEGVRRGGTVVSIRCDDDDCVDEAHQILDRDGAVDIDERARDYRTEGFTGYDPKAPVYTEEQAQAERDRRREAKTASATPPVQAVANGEEQRIPVVQEQVNVDTEVVPTGGVRVRQYVTEHPVQQQVPIREEHVNVERHAVDRPADPSALEAFKEGTIEIRETAERPIVNKDTRVVEEVVVNKEATQTTQNIQDTVRQSHVDVEPIQASSGSFASFEQEFRSDFNRRYASQGVDYEQYAPAYQYGYQLAGDTSFHGREWEAAEPDIRQRWESRNPGTWDRYRDAVRSAYERATTGSNRATLL